MTQLPETPESLGLRLLGLLTRDVCPQEEALALIAAGAEVCVNGNAALHAAAQNGYAAIAVALIENGAHVGAKYNGTTALHRAAGRGHTATVIALIEKGAEIGAKDKSDDTALYLAIQSCHTATVRALIKKGADINAKNDSGNAALHWAVQDFGFRGDTDTCTDIVLTLIENGANIHAKDNNGDTAETLARKYGHTALADLIPAAHLERATRAFRTGLEKATPVPPPLHVKKRRPGP